MLKEKEIFHLEKMEENLIQRLEKSQNVEIFGLDHEFLKLLGMEIHELQKTME